MNCIISGDGRTEVPAPMVALVSTAVSISVYFMYFGLISLWIAALLQEWSSGVCIPRGFSADRFMDTYRCHIHTLDDLKHQWPISYHRIMADLYSAW
jgi:hypothetical protein